MEAADADGLERFTSSSDRAALMARMASSASAGRLAAASWEIVSLELFFAGLPTARFAMALCLFLGDTNVASVGAPSFGSSLVEPPIFRPVSRVPFALLHPRRPTPLAADGPLHRPSRHRQPELRFRTSRSRVLALPVISRRAPVADLNSCFTAPSAAVLAEKRRPAAAVPVSVPSV